MKILNRYTKEVFFEDESIDNIKELLEKAVKGGADLEGADLRGVNLRGAYLEGADLRGAYLEGADLRGANLYRVDLEGAILRGAYLGGANLKGANIKGANLYDTCIRSFQLGKHFGFSYEYNKEIHVRIGCKDGTLEWWLKNYSEIGESKGYSKEEIKNYGILLKAIESMNRGVK